MLRSDSSFFYDSAVSSGIYPLRWRAGTKRSPIHIEVGEIVPKPVGVASNGTKKYFIGMIDNPKISLGNAVAPLCGEGEIVDLYRPLRVNS